MKNVIYFLFLSVCCSVSTFGQSAQNALKKGNKNYEDKKYVQAETSYRLAQSKNKDNSVAEYNMGNSLYRQKLGNEAIATYLRALKKAVSKEEKHRAYHNLGNAYLKEKKYKEAEEAYKNALRNNPKDDETRYNFALAKKLNEEHPDQNQENKDNQDNKDQNKNDQDQQDQDKNEQQDKQDQEKDDQSKDNKDSENKNDKDNQQDQDQNDNQDQNDSDSEPKPTPQQQASKDQMERLLEAINQEERKVQQRLINKDKKGEGKEATGQGTNKKDW